MPAELLMMVGIAAFLAVLVVQLTILFRQRAVLDQIEAIRRDLRTDRSAQVDRAAKPGPAIEEPVFVIGPHSEPPPARAPERSTSSPPAKVPFYWDRSIPSPAPGRFEVAAREILSRTWNWIIVGEDRRSAGYSMEYAVASTWLLRIGVVILVMGIGFFVKYSIEEGLITPTGRVALGILAGVGLLVGGLRLLRTSYHVMGEGLVGGGIATLYFSIYAAANFYRLIGPTSAFAFMGLVTVCAGFLAVRFDSLLVALLGLIGGYGTPVLLGSNEPNYVALFTYLLLLGIGIFGISLRRNWHLLNTLGLICTYALTVASLQPYRSSDFWTVFPFLVAFFALYSTTLFAFNVLHRVGGTLLELVGLAANAGAFFALAYWLVEKRYGYRATAAIAAALAVFYTAHVAYLLAVRLGDRGLLIGFMGLAVFFLAITVPLLLSSEWITVCWAVQALVILRVAGALNSVFLRRAAYVLYGLVVTRFLFLDLPGPSGYPLSVGTPLATYLPGLIGRLVLFGVPIASLTGAYGLLRRSETASREPSAKVAVLTAIAMTFLFLTLEVDAFLRSYVPALRAGGVSILWSLFALGLIAGGIRLRASAIRYVGLALFVVVGVKVLFFDLASLDPFYRIVAFLVLGVLTLGGAFAYFRFRDVFLRDPDPIDPELSA